jgi:hypothetical protein
LALWQIALGDQILGYVAPMLKLLLGWGLALEEALVDEIPPRCRASSDEHGAQGTSSSTVPARHDQSTRVTYNCKLYMQGRSSNIYTISF